MMSLISFMACRISGRNVNFLLGMCVLFCEHGIACALRWGVALVGDFLYWALLTPSWEHISGTGCWNPANRKHSKNEKF